MISEPSPHSQSDWQTSIHAESEGEIDEKEDVVGQKEVISKAEGTPCSPGDDTKESQQLKPLSQTLYNNLSVAFVSIKQPISLPTPFCC